MADRKPRSSGMSISSSRSQLLRRAVVTSLSGKAVTVVTQLLAIPLAISALGVERYGAYAMLTAVFLWTQTASTVVASALSLKLVAAHAEGDIAKEAGLFSTAFFFAAAVACLLCLALQGLVGVVDIGQVFAITQPQFIAELHQAAFWMAWILPLNVVLSLAESAHAGYQRQYVNNLLTMAGNLVTLAALLLAVRWYPSIPVMVLAMFLPAAVGRVANLLILLRGRPHLRPAWGLADKGLLLGLLTMGAAFGVTQVGSFFYQQFPTFYVGRESSLTEAAYFATMMLVIAISGNFLIMFTQPLMPALRDAVARRDDAWIRSTHRLVLMRLVPYISVAALVIALAGSFLVSSLTRQPVHFDPLTQGLWALFFWIVAWEHINYSFLVGMGRLWPAALLYTLGSFLMLALALLLVPRYGILGAFAAMCVGPLVCTVLSFPVWIQRLIRQLDGAVQAAPPKAAT
jgi:O-antigen/teichoic acid export membrane protein